MKRLVEDKESIHFAPPQLVDKFNRLLNYLRISITDRCNLKCVYCTPDRRTPKLPHQEILSYEEILRILRIGIQLGISKVRITGGEPLIRKGVYDFIADVTQLKGLHDVSLTTNGLFLKSQAARIKTAGIRRINVSLDSLKRHKFKKITGYDGFLNVWEGIQVAQELGFAPIKLNVVVLNGINDDELADFARLSFDYPYHIRFIEYMPIGKTRFVLGQDLLIPQVKKRIQRLGELVRIAQEDHGGPAERFQFKGALGEIGFIRPITHHFCNTCNRLRLTADGRLRTCLLSDHQIDFKTPLRSGCSDQDIAEAFRKAVSHKPLGHNLASRQYTRVSGNMAAIGG